MCHVIEDWWSSLEPSIMTKHILMWKNALSFMLRNGLLATHNPGVKFLLEALKYLHRVSVCVNHFYNPPVTIFCRLCHYCWSCPNILHIVNCSLPHVQGTCANLFWCWHYVISKANKRARRTQEVPASTFYVEEIIDRVIPMDDVKLWCFWSTREVIK